MPIRIEVDASPDLPPVHADRVQLQQVILNLVQQLDRCDRRGRPQRRPDPDRGHADGRTRAGSRSPSPTTAPASPRPRAAAVRAAHDLQARRASGLGSRSARQSCSRITAGSGYNRAHPAQPNSASRSRSNRQPPHDLRLCHRRSGLGPPRARRDAAGVRLHGRDVRLRRPVPADRRPGAPAAWSPTCACPAWTASSLCASWPAARSRLPVVLISGHADVPMAVAGIKAGAEDFIEKPIDDTQLVAAINRGLSRTFEQQVAKQSQDALADSFSRLTPRQVEIFDLVASGFTSQAIAASSTSASARSKAIARRSWRRCRPRASPCWSGRRSGSGASHA